MAGFSCDGDAVFCEIAKEQHIRDCVLFDTDNDLSRFGKAVLAGEDPLKAANPAAPENVTHSDLGSVISAAVNAGEPFAGACIQDVTVSVMGRSITAPLSRACPILEMLGNILVSVASLIAIGIIARG